jgi:hypothetical protein
MGERSKQSDGSPAARGPVAPEGDLDIARAEAVLPLVSQLLGLGGEGRT